MKTFHLFRTEDVSGVSGTGTVADGVEFADGVAVIHWRGMIRSTCVYNSVDDVADIHGHDGRTTVVYD